MADRTDYPREARKSPRAGGWSRLVRLEAAVDTLTLCLFVATAALLVDLF
jgi:hypothetical protein